MCVNLGIIIACFPQQRDDRCALRGAAKNVDVSYFPFRLLGPFDYVYGIREGGDHSRRIPLSSSFFALPSQHRTVSPCSTFEYVDHKRNRIIASALLPNFSLARTDTVDFVRPFTNIMKLLQSINRL